MLFISAINNSKRRNITKDQENIEGLKKLYINRSLVPAITHVDYTARVQSVSKELNEPFFKLLENFNNITACPIVVNTSFNVRGEPIVCTPEDAYKCFMKTQLDYLIIGNFILDKRKQT
jgi:Predicted carbamoyl transferase, NodU family